MAEAYYSKLPTSRYACTVNFSCAPANVDKLVAATREEIRTLATQGPPADDFAKVMAEPRLLAAITPADARRAACRYLAPRRLLRFKLLPAGVVQ